MSSAAVGLGGLAYVSLATYRVGDAWVDPVCPEVAALLAPQEMKRLGLLPFALTPTRVLVAAAWPLHEEAPAALATIQERVQLMRATSGDISAAVQRTFSRPMRFGQWAVFLRCATPRQIALGLKAQRSVGGRLGDILLGLGFIGERDVAEIAARQAKVPYVDMGSISREGQAAFDLMPETFWREAGAAPVDVGERSIYVAAEHPIAFAQTHRSLLESAVGQEVRVLTGERGAIERAIGDHFREQHLRTSRDLLHETSPEDSAERLLTRAQSLSFLTVGLAVAAGLALGWKETLLALNVLLQLAYLCLLIFKLWLFRRPASEILEREVTQAELSELEDASLPAYTVLVPLRDEANVLSSLVEGLAMLDYPKDRLDIKLLLEEDDPQTLAAAREINLPAYMHVVVVPDAPPKTKPKACNYGLQHARGEFIVIYDAEDSPDPLQLKKAVIAFRTAPPNVACVQAKLSYYNRMQNALTKWFTAEYAMWFDLMLPALQSASLPIPLGGTSNHLRVDVLREMGAWDPYNVTEDADLGVRLHKRGFRTAIVYSDTYEEANSDFVNWVRQRSRWAKGYMQTWLVHMRHPARLFRLLGGKGFWGFQAVILGTPLVFVLNPLLWTLTTAWFLTQAGIIQAMFPTWVYYTGMFSLLSGNFVFAYFNMVAVARRGEWDLVQSALTAPIYWSLMSLGAWKALVQLMRRPSHWEKTVHGFATRGSHHGATFESFRGGAA